MKLLKTAAIVGIILVAVFIIFGIVNTVITYTDVIKNVQNGTYDPEDTLGVAAATYEKTKTTSFISLILTSILASIFLYGFVELGKKAKDKLLSKSSLVLIILKAIALITGIIVFFSTYVFPSMLATGSVFSIYKSGILLNPHIGFFVGNLPVPLFWVSAVIILLVPILAHLFFGLRIIKLKKHFGGLALFAGVFEIIGGFGFGLGLLVAVILEIILLFKASSSFE